MLRMRYTDVNPAHYNVGMWSWLLHRISGIILVLYGIAHVIVISSATRGGASFDSVMETLEKPWVLALELLLIWAVIFHTFNGFRILLFDLGIGVRVQKQLFWGLMALGVVTFGVAAGFLMPYILGRPLT